MTRSWTGTGPEFRLPWGGREWVLDVAARRPGLQAPEGDVGPLLGLDGVAVVGRSGPDALSGASLAGCEIRLGRVEATYALPDWDELTVRAAWSPSGAEGEGVDLEIQVGTLSVGRIKRLEIKLASILPEPAPTSARRKRWVEPRDARSAMLSYDGREPDVQGLTTLPPLEGDQLAPRVLPSPWPGGGSYVEMVHPHDLARRITETSKISSLGHTTRYGLFGHDLEKGVILRARLRGLWIISKAPERDALDRHEQFLHEPLPLGI
jgi:hypothetical protein